MEATIHCPHCAHLLTVPAIAGGRRAKCLACQQIFIVPDFELEHELEETVCAWIEEDVEQLMERRHEVVEQLLLHDDGSDVSDTSEDSYLGTMAPDTRREAPRERPSVRPTHARHSRVSWPTQLTRPETRRSTVHDDGDANASEPHGPRWEKLSPKLRQRINVWAKLREHERFRHFYPDEDFGPESLGIAGVVLTDKRLIYRKAHHEGVCERWDPNTAVLINTRGDTAVLTMARGLDRDRMVRLSHHDAEQLAAALSRGGGFTVKHVDE